MHVEKLIILLISFFLTRGLAWGQAAMPKIALSSARSVVTIIVLDRANQPISTGSGFFIDRTGQVLTCHHLFAGGLRAVVKTLDGRTGEVVQIAKDSPELDLAVAKTQLAHTLPPVLGDSERISVGQKLYVLGNLRKFRAMLSTGIVSAIRKTGTLRLIQMTAPVSGGFSGAPVFNGSGQVIGIASAFIEHEPALNFAIPINYLKAMKPSRSQLSSLPALSFRWEATVRDDTLVKLLAVKAGQPQHECRVAHGTWKSQRSRKRAIVYFKDGKRLLCDIAWKKGSMVFVVVHGKDFAIGYNDSLIDMRKSFLFSS